MCGEFVHLRLHTDPCRPLASAPPQLAAMKRIPVAQLERRGCGGAGVFLGIHGSPEWPCFLPAPLPTHHFSAPLERWVKPLCQAG